MKEKIIKPGHDALGYAHYILTVEGHKVKLIKAHHLVAEAFLGYDRSRRYNSSDMNSLVVIHLNGIRDDNTVDNLKVIPLGQSKSRRKEKNND